MNLGCRLYSYRKAKNLSQEEVAFALNVTRQTVSKWETGQSTPDFDKILPICELYGITTDELITGEKEESSEELTTNIINSNDAIDPKLEEEKKAKRIGGLAFSIFLYFTAVAWIMTSIPVFKLNPVLSSAIFLIICGIATCIIVYTQIVYKGVKKEKVLSKQEKLIKQIDSVLAVVFTIVYFIVSFMTMAWHITWIIWIIYALISEIVKLVFMLKGEENE